MKTLNRKPVFLMLSLAVCANAHSSEACKAPAPDAPLFISASCVDPQFGRPVIDARTSINQPSNMVRITGHFKGTEATFSIYFPPKAQWRGRFYQTVYPMSNGEVPEATLAFASEDGAFTVATGHTTGYRADAAAAKLARALAREFYQMPDHPIYGYISGGSGGSYQTIAAMENSQGVWDGAVPFVIGTPTSIPVNFFVRAFARVVLAGKAAHIQDAMMPGGSGNPYSGLDATQQDVLREVTAMGVPLQGWMTPSYLLGLDDPQGLMGFADTVQALDPEYADDFWQRPGYLGTERSRLGDIFRSARISMTTPVHAEAGAPQVLRLDQVPDKASVTALAYTLLDAAGASLGNVKGSLDQTHKTFTIEPQSLAQAGDAIGRAAKLRIDNSASLAMTAYHRYQVPIERDFHVWDQFRRPNGTPINPQRPLLAGPVIGGGASGGGQFTGRFAGKMIVIGNLLDLDAFPWDGDWYAQRAKAALGPRFEDSFRLWYNENANHADGSVIISGKSNDVVLVSYVGILQQALRDLSHWVEAGKPPPPTTRYDVANGQVQIVHAASQRGGIQADVDLTMAGKKVVQVRSGEPVTLTGTITLPANVGKVVAVEWSATSEGPFERSSLKQIPDGDFQVRNVVRYTTPGTYYPVLRVTTQRQGDAQTPFALVRNLDRLRVVVH
ncbi:Tat pathway signal sequence domain protein [Pseudomonas putida]|uniref:Tat pathway signal sequence domain protein n=1 Tax=Pseudomonas putida TaxID=303 RepID=UPI00383BA237